MSEALNVTTITPDDHIATLREMVRSFEASASWLNKQGPTAMGNCRARRAAAIRWLLEQNAYGVEATEVVT